MEQTKISFTWLARALGKAVWEGELLLNENQAYAARAVTDFRGDPDKPRTEKEALAAAEWWIKRARREGFDEGTARENARWQNRILRVFEIERTQ